MAEFSNRKREPGALKMSKFQNLRYVTVNSLEAPYDPKAPDSLNNANWGASDLAVKVINERLLCLRWEFDGKTHELYDTFQGGAALDRDADLLVAKIKANNTLVVFQPDSNVDHRVILPNVIEVRYGSAPPARYAVEGVWEILEKDGRVLIGLENRYEFVQRRYYNAKSREWEEIDDNYRK